MSKLQSIKSMKLRKTDDHFPMEPTPEQWLKMPYKIKSHYCMACRHPLVAHSDYVPFDGKGPCIIKNCTCEGQ